MTSIASKDGLARAMSSALKKPSHGNLHQVTDEFLLQTGSPIEESGREGSKHKQVSLHQDVLENLRVKQLETLLEEPASPDSSPNNIGERSPSVKKY